MPSEPVSPAPPPDLSTLLNLLFVKLDPDMRALQECETLSLYIRRLGGVLNSGSHHIQGTDYFVPAILFGGDHLELATFFVEGVDPEVVYRTWRCERLATASA